MLVKSFSQKWLRVGVNIKSVSSGFRTLPRAKLAGLLPEAEPLPHEIHLSYLKVSIINFNMNTSLSRVHKHKHTCTGTSTAYYSIICRNIRANRSNMLIHNT